MPEGNEQQPQTTDDVEKKEDDADEKERLKMISEWDRTANERRELRKSNLEAHKNRPDASFFKTLDSNINKNTKFVKRVRSFAELQTDQKRLIVPEMQKLNLRRYIEELVQAIVAIPMQSSDIPIIAQVISSLHQFYAEFSESIVKSIIQSCVNANSILDLSKFSVVLLLITELHLVGMHLDFSTIYNLVKGLIFKEQDKRTMAVLSSILLFLNMHGDELLVLEHSSDTARLRAQHRAFSKNTSHAVISDAESKQMRDLINNFQQHLCNKLYKDYLDLKQMEEDKHADLMSGVESKSDKTTYDRANRSWFKLYVSTKELSDLMNKELPQNLEQALDRYNESISEALSKSESKRDRSNSDLFEDEESRSFYEDVLDLESILKDTHGADENGMSSVVTSVDKESDDTNNSTEAISTRVEKLMNTLNKSCMSRALMTQWILEFSQVNTKSSRKKLVRTMFAVNRTSLELLPHYSRLVAILSTQYKDVPQQLVASLEDEFNKLFNQKDQIKIETKVKNIRFISELTKFKILPPQTTLSLLDKCLNDFRHHNIDVACHLLETCGRFLYVNKDTHEKTV
ncbi:regulator of nonsense transcript, partial [Acrasis kona]